MSTAARASYFLFLSLARAFSPQCPRVWHKSLVKQPLAKAQIMGCRPYTVTSLSVAADEMATTPASRTERTWNIAGLRKEAERQVLRQLKRCGKAEVRYNKALADEDAKQDTVSELRIEVEANQERLDALKKLEEDIAALGKRGQVDQALEERLLALGVNDEPPERQPRNTNKKKKGPPPKSVEPRKPYRTYESIDGVTVLVGKSAKDNDVLSLDRTIRDQDDWWLHVAGSPGSHVVIRSTLDYGSLPPSTVKDAAVLAALYSKAGATRTTVSLTRCRNISKPAGAKPGLVQIASGAEVVSVKVDLKRDREAAKRLEAQQKSQP